MEYQSCQRSTNFLVRNDVYMFGKTNPKLAEIICFPFVDWNGVKGDDFEVHWTHERYDVQWKYTSDTCCRPDTVPCDVVAAQTYLQSNQDVR